MKIKHPRVYAARTRPTWWLWMGLNTPIFLALFVVQVFWNAVRETYAAWHWTYKHEWKDWFRCFDDRHRNNTRTLGARPEPAGMVMRVTATNARGVAPQETRQ